MKRTVTLYFYLFAGLLALLSTACSSDSDGGQECIPDTTFCEQNTVRKCTTDGTDSVLVQICEFDCNAGSCVSFTLQDNVAEDDLNGGAKDVVIDDVAEDAATEDSTFVPETTEETVVPPQDVSEDLEDEDLVTPPDSCSHKCAENDFYCVGIKEIHYCVMGPDGCRVWDEGASCDDGNDCTDDACAAEKGCVTANNKEACDDGDACTGPDQCSGGECVGGAPLCDCQSNADCAAQEDGNLCNGTLICVENACIVDNATIVTCGGQVGPCVENTCEPQTGNCADKWLANGANCDDGNTCTSGESCSNGSCTGGSMDDCDDNNPCTQDACDAFDGCYYEDEPDGSSCGSNKVCDNGNCIDANQPETLASKLEGPFQLAIDNSSIYFIEDDNVTGTVKKLSKNGGAVTTLAGNLPEPRAMTIDNDFVYWIERNGGSDGKLRKISKNGGAITDLSTGLKNAQNQLKHANGFLYFGDGKQGGGGVIKKVGVNGGTTVLVEGNGLLNLNTAVGVHNGQVYFRNDYDKVLRVSVDGGVVTTLGDGEPSSYAINNSYIFFTEYSNGRLLRMPLNGGSATVLEADSDSAANIAIDATNVYWITDTNKGEVKGMPQLGGNVTLYSDEANTRGLAVDDTYLYFAVSNYSSNGKIMRVLK